MRFLAKLLFRLSPLVDVIVVAGTFSVVWNPDFPRALPEFLVALLVVPFWIVLLRYFGLYESHRLDNMAALARKVLSAQLIGLLALAICLLLESATDP